MKKNVKDIFWNAMGSTLNAVNSLVFLIIVTRINGVKEAGIFTIGYATACLLYTIAVYYGRAFQVTDNSGKYTDKDYLINRIISIALTIFIAVFISIIFRYNIYKLVVLTLLTIFRTTDAYAESLYAVLQRNEKLDIVGKSMSYKALLCYIGFLLVDFYTKNIIFSIIIIIMINLLFVIFYDMKKLQLCKKSYKTYTMHNVLSLFKDGASIFIFTFLSIYLVNSSKYAIDFILNDEMQTIYGIIAMPATVMSLLCNFICHPFLVNIKGVLAKKDYKSLVTITIKLITSAIILGLLIIFVAYIMGIPVLEILYGLDLAKYKLPFMIIMCGALSYGVLQIISQVLIAMRVTYRQTIIIAASSILSLILSIAFVKNNGIIGASLSYMFVMIITCILYVVLLCHCLAKRSKQ